MRYISGLAEAMVASFGVLLTWRIGYPPVEKSCDSLRNSFFVLYSGLLFVSNYRIE